MSGPSACDRRREQFEALLLEVRDGVFVRLTELAVESIREEEGHEAVIADQRAVWHATEAALGILRPGYRPKAEALDDMRRLLAWVDGTAPGPAWGPTWPESD